MTVMRIRRQIAAAAVLAAGAVLAGCGSTATPQPARVAAAPAALPAQCKDGRPVDASVGTAPIPGPAAVGSVLKNRERLRIGVSGDALLWGYSDPTKRGALTGYDVDLARAVAKALGFSKDSEVEFRVLPLSGRIAALNDKDGGVDLVAERFSMTCDRWEGTGNGPAGGVNFSAPYYTAYQKLLVRSDIADKVTNLDSLGSRPVCAVTGSTSLKYLQEKKVRNIVTAADSGQCLVKFQEGEAAAISADETTLAGFAEADRYAEVIDTKIGSPQYYGLGVAPQSPTLTQYVNAALEKLRADGTLTRIYNDTMAKGVPGAPVPTPPAPVTGRDIDKLRS